MTSLDHIKRVYLLGIGGIGMSGLARYFRHLGREVAGYDRSETELTRALAAEGIAVTYRDDPGELAEAYKKPSEETLLIFTPAVPEELKLKDFFRRQGHRLYKRSEVLGIISADRYTIAVAGTHGKTTTSGMIAHILKDAGRGCSAFLGGISSNYGSNVLFGNDNIVVVEADEYDRSFLTLHPDIAVVTSADADHLDIYGDRNRLLESFDLFLDQIKLGGVSIVKHGLPFSGSREYSVDKSCDAYARNVRIVDGDFYFDYVGLWQWTVVENIRLGTPGRHNVENAVAAFTVGLMLGLETWQIKAALGSFAGIKRRFEYIVRRPDAVYIDDYAHHPEELRAFLGSVREMYPERKLTVVFQPHLFSRTRDFAEEFAEVLAMADTLLLMDIYPARELPLAGISSSWLLEKIKMPNKRLASADEIVETVARERPELLVTMGAGDIDRLVEPLKKVYENVE